MPLGTTAKRTKDFDGVTKIKNKKKTERINVKKKLSAKNKNSRENK